MRAESRFFITRNPQNTEESLAESVGLPTYQSLETALEALGDTNVVVLAGSANSLAGPSNAPGWTDLAHEVGRQVIMAAADRGLVEASSVAPLLADIEGFAPKAEALLTSLDACSMLVCGQHLEVTELLRGPLASGGPNGVHITLAAALAEKQIRAVVTTNFDLYFEDALAELGAGDVTVVSTEEQCTERRRDRLLLKIHGSLDAAEGIQATLEQTGRPLSDWRAEALKEVLDGATLVLVGYSGSDSDLFPFLLEHVGLLNRFVWLAENPVQSADLLMRLHPQRGVGATGDLYQLFQAYASAPERGWSPERARSVESSWAGTRTAGSPDFSGLHSGFKVLTDELILAFAAELLTMTGAASTAMDLLASPKIDTRAQGRLLNRLADRHLASGALDEALVVARAAAEAGEAARDLRSLGDACNTIGTVFLARGDASRCEEHWRKSLEIRERDEDPLRLAISKSNVAILDVQAGKWAQALKPLQEALAVHLAAGSQGNVPNLLLNLGRCYRGLEEYGQAATHFRAALWRARNDRNRRLAEYAAACLNECKAAAGMAAVDEE